MKSVERWLKRLLDVTAALAGIILLSPLLLTIAGVIALTMGRPVLFRQQRPGLHGKPFTMFKFRTMRDAFDGNGHPLPDEHRSTSVGRFLRSTSLDEMPELINVIKGEMSLVGPRPLLIEYLERYTPAQMRRHLMPPGITGWAQVNGRNALSWEEKFDRDVFYVDHWSLWMDVRILWITIAKVVRREGVSAAGHETMPVFKGSGGNGL